MKIKHEFRVAAGFAALMGACLSLTGCMSSPTYGTDKTAAEQLVDDLSSAVTVGSSKPKNNIAYSPRPGLVLPKDKQLAALVAPQQSVAGKDNPQWVESPEETRSRLVAEADENKNKPHYRSPLATTGANGRALSDKEQQAAYRAARAEQNGAYEERRFLSDPPSKYRAADPAALTDLGEPEKAKEKRRKKAAVSDKQDSSWWVPFQ